MKQSTHDVIQPSRLSEAERKAMLDRLDAADAANPARNRRGMPRLQYRRDNRVVHVHHPGGSTTVCYVTTRNLSDGGVSFLYNGFLYKGTRAEIVLPRFGKDDTIVGLVQHCALVHRMVHLVGVKFKDKVFAKLYLNPSEWGDAPDMQQADQAALTGTVVHLAANDIDHQLLEHFLKGTAIKAQRAKSPAEVIALIRAQAVQGLLCTMESGQPVEGLLPQFRAAGYVGPIAVLSEQSVAAAKSMEKLGFVFLNKPFHPQTMFSLLATWLQTAKAA